MVTLARTVTFTEANTYVTMAYPNHSVVMMGRAMAGGIAVLLRSNVDWHWPFAVTTIMNDGTVRTATGEPLIHESNACRTHASPALARNDWNKRLLVA